MNLYDMRCLKIKKYFFTIFLFSLISCTTFQHDISVAPLTKSSYDNDIKNLSLKIYKQLEQYKKNNTIFIKNINTNQERKLARRFIDDLSGKLANMGINIKKEKIAAWSGGISDEQLNVNCQEVLEILASDFFLEFSLKECPESDDYVQAQIRAIKRDDNRILFSEKESIYLIKNIKKWYEKIHDLKPKKGTFDNPYINYHEAANSVVAKLSCLVKNLFPNETIKIVIGKTERTQSDIINIFSDFVTKYGLNQIAPSSFLPEIIKAGDLFEMKSFDKKKHREHFATANVILVIDTQAKNDDMVLIRANLTTLNSVKMKKNDQDKIINAGMCIPHCAEIAYILNDSLPIVKKEKTIKKVVPSVSKPEDKQKKIKKLNRISKKTIINKKSYKLITWKDWEKYKPKPERARHNIIYANYITYNEVINYAKWISEQDHLYNYRLPTKKEVENYLSSVYKNKNTNLMFIFVNSNFYNDPQGKYSYYYCINDRQIIKNRINIKINTCGIMLIKQQ
ncbi:hypothetical protein GMMP15_1960002 [Candidatus Magnetomoraceae bacterium gMMP-15]